MMFRPRHGLLGLVILPYTFVSLALPIVFLPLLYAGLINSVLAGHHSSILVIAALFTLGQGLICASGSSSPAPGSGTCWWFPCFGSSANR